MDLSNDYKQPISLLTITGRTMNWCSVNILGISYDIPFQRTYPLLELFTLVACAGVQPKYILLTRYMPLLTEK